MHKGMSGSRNLPMYRGLLLLISIPLLVLAIGCATPSSKTSRSLKKEESAYNKAVKENTVESYKKFIEKYPDGANTENAKRKLVKLEWEKAAAENTVEAYRTFIKEYKGYPSDSSYFELAQRNIEALTKKSAKGKKLNIGFLKDIKSGAGKRSYTRFIKSVKKTYEGSSALSFKDVRIFRKTFWIDLLSRVWQGIRTFFRSVFIVFRNYHEESMESGRVEI